MNPITPEAQHPVPNILVVDDTPANLNLLTEMLKKSGYKARPVPGGKLAIQAVQNEKPDLILLDINMPEMDGYEVCEHLKADAASKDIPILFISAMTDTMDKVKAFSAGGVDYVTKPFQFEEVHARVEAHLRIHFLECQLNEQNENLERLVAERTRELVKTYKQLLELSRLKDDFLCMISHEIRTPANGVLGVGNMILALCPDSEHRTLAAEMFNQSTLRLQNLIDDATMIADMERLILEHGAAVSFPALLSEVKKSIPEIQISIEPSAALETVLLKGNHPLLKKALRSTLLLAAAFSRNKHSACGTAVIEDQALRVQIKLDDISLSSEQVADFFKIESQTRSLSSAESLGLSPVVAYQIISAFGGGMKLVKGEGCTGYLEVVLRKEQDGEHSSDLS
jgi:DNA-binding response OmpR family regulator